MRREWAHIDCWSPTYIQSFHFALASAYERVSVEEESTMVMSHVGLEDLTCCRLLGQIHLFNLDKYTFSIWTNIHVQFGQIHTCVTHSLMWVWSIARAASSLSSIFGPCIHSSDLDKYILRFGQIYFVIWTNTFCNLNI